MNHRYIVTAILAAYTLTGITATGDTSKPAPVSPPAASAKHPAEAAPQWAGDDSPATTATLTARAIVYGEKDVVPVKTKLRYTTLIVLPKDEQILDFTCGDKEFWVVNGNQNFAYVKPAKAGARTNLNLVTASGNVYSFMLAEVSETPKVDVDLKLFLEPRDA